MFSRAAAAAAATARRAERAARHRPPPSSSGPSGVGLAFAETSTPTFARRARSCASTARWTAPAGPLATDASARVRAGFEPRRRSFASSSAAAAATPHETAFAAIETDAERAASFAIETETETETSFPETGGGVKDSHGVRPSTTPGIPTITRTRSPAHRPREYAVPVRAYYVGNVIDFHALAKRLPAYPKEFFRECVVVRMTPRANVKNALGVNEHLTGVTGVTGHGAPHRPRARSSLSRHDTPEGDHLNDGIHPGARAFVERNPPSAPPSGKKARRGGGNREQLETLNRGTDSSQLVAEPSGLDFANRTDDSSVNHHTSEGGLRVGETPRYLVVYKYGSAVFFNMGRREREECLKLVRSFAKAPLAVPCTDDYRVMVRPGLEPWAQFEADHVVLKRLDLNNVSVIGTVLAQTVALEHHEIKVDNMIEIFSGLNKSTEETGEMDISKARLFKLVAENNNTLTELVTRMRLLGRSDTAWQYAQYDAVWNGLRKDFELEDRFDHLDYKLNLIQTQVKFYLEILQNRKSDTLEWIIIVLISMEILVSLYDMSTKLG